MASSGSAADAMNQALWAEGRFRRTFRRSPEAEIVFGQVREDPQLEIAALNEVTEPSPGALCIGSAGCTALSLLAVSQRPLRLTIVDINPAQLSLIRLKAAMISHCDLAALRMAVTEDARPGYDSVRDIMEGEDRRFWEAHRHLLAMGLNRCGSVDRRLSAALRLLYWSVVSRERIQETLSAPTIDAQAVRFARDWDSPRWRAALHLALSRAVLRAVYGKAFLVRVPPDFAGQIRGSLAALLSQQPAHDNGYLWQAFLQTYPPQSEGGLPPYLREASFARLRLALPQARYVRADVVDHLAAQPERGLHFLALSNVLDAATPEDAARLFTAAFRATAYGGILCLRSLFPAPEEFRAAAARAGWAADTDLGRMLEQRNRSPFCRTSLIFRRTIH